MIPVLFFVGQTILEPTVTVHYAENGKEELKYIWNVQHRIYKGRMQPGGGTSDNGFIFPDEDFFMQLDWWSEKGRHHCVSITPKWPNTDIYLDLNGNIDTEKGVGTDEDRLDQCKGGWAKP
ncbi:hypothetical protein HKW95_11010 [Pseudomonas chlororaphis subsp. aurantiaca]|nr:hypothetical protein U724_19205 [Pseudomonas chlororaphis subsp. aurantiaca PB-St2]QFS58655.1 hypothetical protein FD951_08125 [Pseudomonas chlororaphis subsp. aurantiaca]